MAIQIGVLDIWQVGIISGRLRMFLLSVPLSPWVMGEKQCSGLVDGVISSI